MSRKTKLITIVKEDRDVGKQFLITEASSDATEHWGLRVFMAMSRANIDIDASALDAGMAGVATIALRSLASMQFADAVPLLAEMMLCVKYVPAGARGMELARHLVETDVEEITTLLLLREEVIDLHVGFSVRDAIQEHLAARAQERILATETSQLSSAP